MSASLEFELLSIRNKTSCLEDLGHLEYTRFDYILLHKAHLYSFVELKIKWATTRDFVLALFFGNGKGSDVVLLFKVTIYRLSILMKINSNNYHLF